MTPAVSVQPANGFNLSLLSRIAARPVCFIAFTESEWPAVVQLGIAGLVCWPRGEVLISATDDGRAILASCTPQWGAAA